MSDDLAAQALAAHLVQPDQTTCGSSVLVMSHVLNDPGYAALVVEGRDPATGESAPGTIQQRFASETLAMHELTSGLRDSSGGLQFPWPSALGTRPWAIAREMTLRCGRPGMRYRARLVVPWQRDAAFSRLVQLSRRGLAAPLFVGNQWSPRHVVLVLPVADGIDSQVLLYDPASGLRYPIDRADFVAATLRVSGWSLPWVLVAP